MKKLGRILLVATALASIMSMTIFAAPGGNKSVELSGPTRMVASIYETTEAIPLNTSAKKVGLSYGYSLDVSLGWIAGCETHAYSNSFVTGKPDESFPIDYMYIKILITKVNGSTYDSSSDTDTSSLSLDLTDSAAASYKSVKSTHTFKNADYSDTTKYMTKTF